MRFFKKNIYKTYCYKIIKNEKCLNKSRVESINFKQRGYIMEFKYASLSVFAVLFTHQVSAAVIPVNKTLVDKLNAQGSKIVTVANLGPGYTFRSAAYTGNFAASPAVFSNLAKKVEPLSASSTFVGACFPASYSITASVTSSTESGQSFTSSSSLDTDTTVKVEASYMGASVSAVTNIKTSDSKTDSYSSQNLNANTATAGMQADLNCTNTNQPQFFQAVGSTNQNIWYDSVTGSTDITYTYDSFPASNNQFNTANFTATLFKAGTRAPGQGLKIIFYDKNNKVLAEYSRDATACFNSPNSCSWQVWGGNEGQAFFGTKAHNSAYRYVLSFGGNASNIGVRLSNQKGQWTTLPQTINQALVLPKNFGGSDLGSVELTNRDVTTTPDSTRTVTIPVNKILSYDEAKVQVSGIYNASSVQDLAMNVIYTRKSWEQLNAMGGYTDTLKGCGGSTLAEAKASWKQYCGSKQSKGLPLKMMLNKALK